MIAAACGMGGLLNIFLWINSSRDKVFILPSVMAFSATANVIIELLLFSSATPVAYQYLILWANLFIALMLLSMVWFVYAYFHTARRWLAIAISALWGAGLFVNFVLDGTLTFTEVKGLRTMMTFWGEAFVIPDAVVNPFHWLPDSASFLIVIFIVDASIRLWRKGMHQRAAIIGGSILLLILFAGIHSPLVDAGIIKMPYMVSFAFIFIVIAQTYSLTYDAVKAQRLSKEVKVNEERWRSLMTNIQLAAVGFDGNGIITFINPHMESMLGYTRQELLGKPITIILLPEEATSFKERLSQARLTGPRPHSRWTLCAKSGEKHILDWSTVELRTFDGTVTGFLSLGLDVTDRLESELELGRLQQGIAHISRVASIGELTSSLAHELNQPLAAILNNAQAARRFLSSENPDMSEIEEILQDIIRDDKRAGDVISGLRAMLRKEKQVVETFDLGIAVSHAAELLKSEFTIQKIELDLQLAQNAYVRTVRNEILQVVMNLMMNAVQAMKDTPPESRSMTVRTIKEDSKVVLFVRDSGCGISQDIMDPMFEPFLTTKSSGLGMGLSICRRVVENNGGRVWAENNEESGATFYFTLPLETGHDGDENG